MVNQEAADLFMPPNVIDEHDILFMLLILLFASSTNALFATPIPGMTFAIVLRLSIVPKKKLFPKRKLVI